MKSIAVINKNIKLLFRSKGSAAVVLLGPLFIVLIIGFSFAENTQTALNVAIHARDNSQLTQRYITNLNTSEYNLIIYEEEQKCIDSIKEGTTLACIIFPENFVLSDEIQNEVLFYVDDSRINLVHRLVAQLSINLDTESTEVRQELTSRLLEILSNTKIDVDASIAQIIASKAYAQTANNAATKAKNSLDGLDVNEVKVDISGTTNAATTTITDLKTLKSNAKTVITRGYAVLESGVDNSTAANALESSLNSLNTTINLATVSDLRLEELETALQEAQSAITQMKTKLDNTRSVKTSLVNDVNTLSTNIQKLITELDGLKAKQEKIKADIESFNLKSADAIVNPITTKIEPVASTNTRITYSFPYLLMLIVLLVGLMLSGTLVYMEKDSKAFFRTFTTPSRTIFFIWMTYLTSAIIILIQAAIVLAVAYFALGVPVLENIEMTLLILFISMTVFIFLGMFIGHLFSTSEGITMSTIALGSILMFLSNLILPVETLAPEIQRITEYNPFVMSSEGIRKAMLFGTGIEGLYVDLLIMLGYATVIIIITITLIKFISSRFMTRMHILSKKTKISVPEDHYLKILSHGLIIKNLHELLVALQSLSFEEYSKLITPKNVFADWISSNYRAKRLALHMRTKNREKAIKTLERYLEKKHL